MTILDLEINKGTTFGPVQLLCKDALGVPVPLAGWAAYSECRDESTGNMIVDFSPVIEVDDADGLITLPEIAWNTTDDMPTGVGEWDLILQNPDGKRLPPFIGGRVIITLPVTRKPT